MEGNTQTLKKGKCTLYTDRTQQMKSVCGAGLGDVASLGIWDTLQLDRLNNPCRIFL